MQIKEAYNNLASVVLTARIETNVGPLTGQEHDALRQSLQLLHQKALDGEEAKTAAKEPDKKKGK